MLFRDYLSLLRRRFWLVLLPALIFGAGAAAAVLLPAPQYTATAVIAAPANVGGSGQNEFTGLTGQRDFVADVQAAVTTPTIVDSVAAKVHASRSEVAGCLSASPVGLSSVMGVTCTSQQRRLPGPVANAAAAATVTFLFQSPRDVASSQLEEAAGALSTATAALRTFEAQNGPVVDRTYANDLLSINQLRLIADAQLATGHPDAAVVSESNIAALQSQIIELQPKVAQYQLLATAKTEAALNYDHAARDLREPLLQYDAANPSRTVRTTATTKVSRTSKLIHLLAPVTLGGLLVGMLLVIYPEQRRQERSVPQVGPPVLASSGP